MTNQTKKGPKLPVQQLAILGENPLCFTLCFTFETWPLLANQLFLVHGRNDHSAALSLGFCQDVKHSMAPGTVPTFCDYS
jgi:hypothetical protein